jgi:predicted cupin superfamily sugar epimerase
VNAAAREVIAALRLEPLPHEGGYFRATWRNATSSAILFLITPEGFSALHRLAQDELWHFHAGDPVEHVQIQAPGGAITVSRLGPAVTRGDRPQLSVPAGTWQGARLAEPRQGFALLGCTVSPPWDQSGFEIASRAALQAAFPQHDAIVRALTR